MLCKFSFLCQRKRVRVRVMFSCMFYSTCTDMSCLFIFLFTVHVLADMSVDFPDLEIRSFQTSESFQVLDV